LNFHDDEEDNDEEMEMLDAISRKELAEKIKRMKEKIRQV
jgi:hypothetical protein